MRAAFSYMRLYLVVKKILDYLVFVYVFHNIECYTVILRLSIALSMSANTLSRRVIFAVFTYLPCTHLLCSWQHCHTNKKNLSSSLSYSYILSHHCDSHWVKGKHSIRCRQYSSGCCFFKPNFYTKFRVNFLTTHCLWQIVVLSLAVIVIILLAAGKSISSGIWCKHFFTMNVRKTFWNSQFVSKIILVVAKQDTIPIRIFLKNGTLRCTLRGLHNTFGTLREPHNNFCPRDTIQWYTGVV